MKKLGFLLVMMMGLFVTSCEVENEDEGTGQVSIVGLWNFEGYNDGNKYTDNGDQLMFNTDGTVDHISETTDKGVATYEVIDNQLHLTVEDDLIIFETKVATETKFEFETMMEGSLVKWVLTK